MNQLSKLLNVFEYIHLCNLNRGEHSKLNGKEGPCCFLCKAGRRVQQSNHPLLYITRVVSSRRLRSQQRTCCMSACLTQKCQHRRYPFGDRPIRQSNHDAEDPEVEEDADKFDCWAPGHAIKRLPCQHPGLEPGGPWTRLNEKLESG
jgi:hypothetical protein